MEWHESVFELIDMRSFSNLWYWIALAVMWSTAAHWIVGVPFDLVQRASRKGGQAEIDLNDLVRINCNRLLYIAELSGIWLLGFACFILSGLAVLGFYYSIEFAQAVLLLALPMSFVAALNVRTAARIRGGGLTGDPMVRQIRIHRLWVQAIAMISIFVTGFWGMWQNLNANALGS